MKRPGQAERRTLATGLEEPGAPLYFSAPPNLMSLPMATRQSALHKPVTAEVVSVLDDLVPLLRRLFLGCTTHTHTYMVNMNKIQQVGEHFTR